MSISEQGALPGFDELTRQYISVDGKHNANSNNYGGNDTAIFASILDGGEPAGGLDHVRGASGQVEMAELVAVDYNCQMYYEEGGSGPSDGFFVAEFSWDSSPSDYMREKSGSIGGTNLASEPVSEIDNAEFADIEEGAGWEVDPNIVLAMHTEASHRVHDTPTGTGSGGYGLKEGGFINYRRELGGGPVASPHDELHMHWAMGNKPNINDHHVAVQAQLFWDTYTEE